MKKNSTSNFLNALLTSSYFLLPFLTFILSSTSYGSVNIESGFRDAQEWTVKIGASILGVMIVIVGIFYSIGSSNASQKLSNWIMGAVIIGAGGGITSALLGFWR